MHTRLDPIERTAIDFASRLAIDEINGQILAEIVEGGQGLARPASDGVLDRAQAAISTLDACHRAARTRHARGRGARRAGGVVSARLSLVGPSARRACPNV